MLSCAGSVVQSGFRRSRTNPPEMALGKYSRHVLFLLFATVLPLRGQTQEPAPAVRDSTRALVTIGSVAEDRLRLQQILGDTSTAGYLLRSASSQTPEVEVDSGEVRWSVISPRISTIWNSDLPFSMNDGALWAGRGANVEVMGGVRLASERLSLIIAPELIHQRNRDFQIIPNPIYYVFDPFASPFHTFPESLDLPLRFGDEPFTTLSLGQSTLAVSSGPVVIGASTENQWWGPGIRNAIVLSNHAAGFPHLFLRSSTPLTTPVGDFEGKWIVGALKESRYFDLNGGNNNRFLSGLVATLRLRWEPNLTLGFARTVFGPTDENHTALFHLFDVWRDVGRPNARPVADPEREEGPDQLFSLFGRWIFPEDGFEVYGEWARHERPRSIRDFLTAPNHSQGYTVGFQWARPGVDGSIFRLQSEVTNLEQSATFRTRRVTTFYKSRPVLQGYTQRGQVLGASIGPGASSQWIAADHLASDWQAGVFGGRIRWENDAYYAVYPFRTPAGHDVTVFGGVRGAYQFGTVQVEAEYAAGKRFNYLFQNTSPSFEDIQAVDIFNHTLQLVVTPFLGPR